MVINDGLAKAGLRLFTRRGMISPPPISKINSDGSTPTSDRHWKRIGRLTDFQTTRLQLFEIINELFADTVVIDRHDKLLKNSIVDGETDCRSGFHSRQIAPAHCRVRNPAYKTGVICRYSGILSP